MSNVKSSRVLKPERTSLRIRVRNMILAQNESAQYDFSPPDQTFSFPYQIVLELQGSGKQLIP